MHTATLLTIYELLQVNESPLCVIENDVLSISPTVSNMIQWRINTQDVGILSNESHLIAFLEQTKIK